EAQARHRGPGPRSRPVPRGADRPDVEREHDRRRRGILAVARRILVRRIRGLAMIASGRSTGQPACPSAVSRAPAVLPPLMPLACATAAGWPALAAAQAQAPERQIDTSRGPSSELYIRKRPPAPEAPVLSTELKTLLASTEKQRDDKRLEAIGLLRAFL